MFIHGILSVQGIFISILKSTQSNTLVWSGEVFHHLSDTLNKLETQLEQQDFVRIHRSYLINIHHIKEIQRYFNGS